jgi:hypothetical protein
MWEAWMGWKFSVMMRAVFWRELESESFWGAEWEVWYWEFSDGNFGEMHYIMGILRTFVIEIAFEGKKTKRIGGRIILKFDKFRSKLTILRICLHWIDLQSSWPIFIWPTINSTRKELTSMLISMPVILIKLFPTDRKLLEFSLETFLLTWWSVNHFKAFCRFQASNHLPSLKLQSSLFHVPNCTHPFKYLSISNSTPILLLQSSPPPPLHVQPTCVFQHTISIHYDSLSDFRSFPPLKPL